MTMGYDMIVDRKDHVQYLTVSNSYSDDCMTFTEQNRAINEIYYVAMMLYIAQYSLI